MSSGEVIEMTQIDPVMYLILLHPSQKRSKKIQHKTSRSNTPIIHIFSHIGNGKDDTHFLVIGISRVNFTLF